MGPLQAMWFVIVIWSKHCVCRCFNLLQSLSSGVWVSLRCSASHLLQQTIKPGELVISQIKISTSMRYYFSCFHSDLVYLDSLDFNSKVKEIHSSHLLLPLFTSLYIPLIMNLFVCYTHLYYMYYQQLCLTLVLQAKRENKIERFLVVACGWWVTCSYPKCRKGINNFQTDYYFLHRYKIDVLLH